MVKDVTKFRTIWGDQDMLECVCVCVQDFKQNFGFGRGGTPKFGVDVEGVYGGESGGMLCRVIIIF